MGQQASYILVPAVGAFCIEPVARGNNVQEIHNKTFENRPSQKWLIEPGQGDNIAFKNLAANQYLHATGSKDRSDVVLGARQWWTLERGAPPGSVWVRNENGSYLCKWESGLSLDTQIVVLEPGVEGDRYKVQKCLWYIQDAVAWERNWGTKMNLALAAAEAAGVPANQQHEQAQAQREAALEAREKDVADAEARAEEREQQQAGLEAREEQALKRAQELATSRKTVREKLAKLKSEEQAAEKQQQQLEAERKAFAEKQKKLEAREKAVAEHEGTKGKGGNGGSKNAASQLETLQKQNKELEEQLEQHEKETHASTASQERIEKLQSELAQAHEQADFASSYEDRINQLEAELSTARSQLSSQQQQARQQQQQQRNTSALHSASPISITSSLRTQDFVRDGRKSDQRAPVGMQSAAERASVGDRDVPPRLRTMGPAPGAGRERSPLRFSSGKGAGGFRLEDLGKGIGEGEGNGAGGFGLGDLGKGMEGLGKRYGSMGGGFGQMAESDGEGRMRIPRGFSRLPRLA